MSVRASTARRIQRRALLATWHRRLGLTAAAVVLVLAVTGIALNHTDALGLDERYVWAPWLLSWYGIEAPAEAESCDAGGTRVTRLGDRLYFGRRLVEHDVGSFTGAVPMEGLTVVAVDGDLLILTADGDRVERLGRADGAPAGISGLGLDAAGRVLVRAAHGLYRADPGLLGWTHAEAEETAVGWASLNPPDESLLAALRQDYLANILTLERVLLDIHSGRVLGPAGPWLMDAAAILLLVLALTGIWMWTALRR
jgi:hypothetical protein